MLDTKVVSLSFSLTVTALYIVCAVIFYLFPIGSLELFNTWFHGVDLARIAAQGQRTAVSFFVGLVSAFVFSYVFSAVFAVLYNAFSKRRAA